MCGWVGGWVVGWGVLSPTSPAALQEPAPAHAAGWQPLREQECVPARLPPSSSHAGGSPPCRVGRSAQWGAPPAAAACPAAAAGLPARDRAQRLSCSSTCLWGWIGQVRFRRRHVRCGTPPRRHGSPLCQQQRLSAGRTWHPAAASEALNSVSAAQGPAGGHAAAATTPMSSAMSIREYSLPRPQPAAQAGSAAPVCSCRVTRRARQRRAGRPTAAGGASPTSSSHRSAQAIVVPPCRRS